MNPDIYLLDEPSSNLDMDAIQDLRKHLKLVKQQGKTILIAEHRLYYLMDVVDRIVYMEQGQIAGIYTPEQFRAIEKDERKHMGLRAVDLHEVHPQFTSPGAAENKILKLQDVGLYYKKQATYLERTGLRFEPSDYVSFGLTDKNGLLTNAGKLMTDQHTVYNSRMFCTRWNGLEKGSIFDDALDDKEYEGNLIYLLKSGSEFIRNNSKVRFVKEAQYRVDKPDYAERAVTEALVNALIHRDYIVLGSEIHIDMFDDRVEITSPGGMFGGGSIQEYDIYSIRSMRRNPVIADLFHRMKYMERRGSGLRKIVSETEKLPGYTEAYKPEFSSTATDFRVILKNVNYIMCGASAHDTAHDAAHDTSVISKQNLLLEFCADPKSRDEMQAYIDVSSRSHFSKYYLKPLLSSGKLEMMFPDKPKSKNQKYTTVHSK